MSEPQTSTASQASLTAASVMSESVSIPEQQTAGAMLRQAREISGLHIAALAVLLKVPVKKLEALESDRLDLLPDAVFVRALASSVCRTLKIDAATVLARLPQTGAPKLTYQGTSINEPFRSPGYSISPTVLPQVSQPAIFAGLLLLMGALILIFLPAIKTGISDLRGETREGKTTPDKVIVEARVIDSQSIESLSVPSAETKKFDVASSGQASLTSSIAAVTELPLAAKSSLAVTLSNPSMLSSSKVLSAGTSSPTSTEIANAPLASDVVVFTAKTESWVEATDATSKIVLRRTLAAGEIIGANGVLPLKVIVGRASATQVQIRGKAFDVNAVAKNNVARFEVK